MSIGDTLNGSLETDDAEWRAYCHALATGDTRTMELYEAKWDRDRYRKARGHRPEQEGCNDG